MTDERTNKQTDEQKFVNVESLSRLKIKSVYIYLLLPGHDV